MGSSPPARGTSQGSHRWHEMVRLIPARAGNTTIISPPLRHHKAHPRSRGEHENLARGAVRAHGSSPLARGTWRRARRQCTFRRLIPARAGNIGFFGCGGVVGSGSSPLARGPPSKANHHVSRDGLIPARAGSTFLDHQEPPSCPAHPRSSGEHVEVEEIVKFNEGSSPLARGTLGHRYSTDS